MKHLLTKDKMKLLKLNVQHANHRLLFVLFFNRFACVSRHFSCLLHLMFGKHFSFASIWILVLAGWYYRLNLWSVSEKLFTYLTCIAVISFGFIMFVLHLKLDLGVFFYQMCNQNCLQQTEQHKGKNHNAVCCWKDETNNSFVFFFFWYLVLLHTWNTSPHLNIIP